MSPSRPGPPRLPRALLRLLTRHDRGTIDGDLDEEYRRFVLPRSGRAAANRWYWRQVIGSAPNLLRRRLGFESVARDVRHGWRVLVRRPGSSLAVVATLAVALAANTAVFTVVHSTVLEPLPYGNVDRLVRPLPASLFWLDGGQAAELERRLTTAESLSTWGRSLFLFERDGETEEVRGGTVEWDHFQTLGTTPLLGRGFVEEDAHSGDAIVLSHGLWLRRFGADPAVVGTTIPMFDATVRIVGVMGPDHVPMEYDWQAWTVRTFEVDYGGALAAHVLRHPEATLTEVENEVREALLAIWAEGGYEPSAEQRAEMIAVPIDEWLLGDARGSLGVLLGAVALILLLACLNVSALQLAQIGRRAQELDVRSALGGGRAAVGRQLAAELFLLALVAGGAGILLGQLLLGVFGGMLPEDLPRVQTLTMSGPVVAFAILATLVAALLAGALPWARATRAGGRSDSGSSATRAHTAGRGAEAGTGVVGQRTSRILGHAGGRSGPHAPYLRGTCRGRSGLRAGGPGHSETGPAIQPLCRSGGDRCVLHSGRRAAQGGTRSLIRRLDSILAHDSRGLVVVLPVGGGHVFRGAKPSSHGRPAR